MNHKVIALRIQSSFKSDLAEIKAFLKNPRLIFGDSADNILNRTWHRLVILTVAGLGYVPWRFLYNLYLIPADSDHIRFETGTLHEFKRFYLEELEESSSDIHRSIVLSNLRSIDWVLTQRQKYGDLDTILGRIVNRLAR